MSNEKAKKMIREVALTSRTLLLEVREQRPDIDPVDVVFLATPTFRGLNKEQTLRVGIQLGVAVILSEALAREAEIPAGMVA